MKLYLWDEKKRERLRSLIGQGKRLQLKRTDGIEGGEIWDGIFFLEDLKAEDRIVISVVEFGAGRKGQGVEVGSLDAHC